MNTYAGKQFLKGGGEGNLKNKVRDSNYLWREEVRWNYGRTHTPGGD